MKKQRVKSESLRVEIKGVRAGGKYTERKPKTQKADRIESVLAPFGVFRK